MCFTKTQGLYSNVNVCIVCCDKARLFTWYSLLLKYKIGNVQTMGVQLHENIHDLLVVDLSSIVNVYMFIRARRMRAWLLPSMIVTTFSRRLMVEKLLSHSQDVTGNVVANFNRTKRFQGTFVHRTSHIDVTYWTMDRMKKSNLLAVLGKLLKFNSIAEFRWSKSGMARVRR